MRRQASFILTDENDPKSSPCDIEYDEHHHIQGHVSEFQPQHELSDSKTELCLDLEEKIMCMKRQEENYKCRPYSMKSGSKTSILDVDESCREQIVDWSFRVIDYFQLNRNVVMIAISYLDRYLSEVEASSQCMISDTSDDSMTGRKAFKLAATSSLYIAIKLHGDQHQINSETLPLPGDMVYILSDLSRGEFSVDNILRMEVAILNTLSWLMNPPTSSEFVQFFLQLFSKKLLIQTRSLCPQDDLDKALESKLQSVLSLALFFTELSLVKYPLCIETDPSMIALGSFLNGLELVLENDSDLQEANGEIFDKIIEDLVSLVSYGDGDGLNDDTITVLSETKLQLFQLYQQTDEYKSFCNALRIQRARNNRQKERTNRRNSVVAPTAASPKDVATSMTGVSRERVRQCSAYRR